MIYLITGGQRSGKSSYAQKLALSLDDNPVYVATARIWDKDFERRVERHKDDRGDEWTTIEEEKVLGDIDMKGKVVVIDCITLWLTNFFSDNQQNIDKSMRHAKQELDKLTSKDATLIIVTNELGMGTHAHSESGRKFSDLQGWINQHIAKMADKVILMVSGIPITIKEK